MIKFENTEVNGWEAAIRGMRNPMNSWEQSDSGYGCADKTCKGCNFGLNWCGNTVEYKIGEKDLDLMKRLVKAGSDHSKFMRMINVTVDITAPLYWWKEFDTYKVGTVRNSCSTMHKIMDKEFEDSDFSWDKTSFLLNEACQFENTVVDELNYLRKRYLMEKSKATKDIKKRDENAKAYWYALIQYLPSSYNQRATIQMNYAVLRNMDHSRKNHKLDEWSIGFVEWVNSLPYHELITCDFKEEK